MGRLVALTGRRFSAEALLIVFVGTFAAIWSVDLGGSLRADSWLTLLGGREIAEHGLPHSDALAVVSHGERWIDQQWLAQLGFYELYRFGGLGVVLRANILLFVTPLCLGLVAARRRGASPSRVLILALPALLLTGSFLRAQVLSQIFFVALLLLLLAESRRPSRRVLLAFPLLVVWANVHGAVIVGAALTAILGVVELVRRAGRRRPTSTTARTLALLIAPWLCVGATPYGFDMLEYYRSTIGNPLLARYVTEWRSTEPLTPWGVPFFLLAAVGLWLIARRPRRLNAFELLVLVLTFVGGLLAVRSIVWFVYVCVILLPPLLEDVWPSKPSVLRGRDHAIRAAACLASVGLALVIVLRPSHSLARHWPSGGAAAVSGVLRSDPRANVLASEEYADWVLFTVPAARGRIAFDGRWEILPRRRLTTIMDFLLQRGPSWEAPSRGYRLLVLDPQRRPQLVDRFAHGPGVRVLYRDESVVVVDRGRAR